MENIIKQIPHLIPNFCDRCGARHVKSDLEILNSDLDKVTCRLVCRNCGNIYMLQVGTGSDGMSAKKASVFSDIKSQSEARLFSNKSPISSEEIVDVIIAMKSVRNFDDFRKLIVESD